jgi:hypothetical protein
MVRVQALFGPGRRRTRRSAFRSPGSA